VGYHLSSLQASFTHRPHGDHAQSATDSLGAHVRGRSNERHHQSASHQAVLFGGEFTERKCAESGKHLTDQQVLEIEAQVMEYFGKQRVEAGKILDKCYDCAWLSLTALSTVTRNLWL
jgi:hypothetical protein